MHAVIIALLDSPHNSFCSSLRKQQDSNEQAEAIDNSRASGTQGMKYTWAAGTYAPEVG
jgi:putative IMPACT (imprinted ancient) family translation regulator